MRPFDDLERLERLTVLDKPAAVIRRTVQKIVSNPAVKDALHGVWLGHSLHPALAQVTLGSFISASLIDLVGGDRKVSSGLMVTGLAAAVPTVAAGWTDWSESNPDQQRVGLVHASSNYAAVLCYAGALLQRRRGRSGRLLSLAGLALGGSGATIGGHLSYRQGLGPNHVDRIEDLAPKEWESLGPVADLRDGEPVRRLIGDDVPVMVVRRGADFCVLSDRCPHLAAPLHEGELIGTDGDARIVCPWHGSQFFLDDGEVARGPATAAAARFETRVVGEELQARFSPEAAR